MCACTLRSREQASYLVYANAAPECSSRFKAALYNAPTRMLDSARVQFKTVELCAQCGVNKLPDQLLQEQRCDTSHACASWQRPPLCSECALSGCSVVANAKQRKTPAAAKHSVLESKRAAGARGRGRGRGRGRESDRSASVETYKSLSDDEREVGSRVVEPAALGGKISDESSDEATSSESDSEIGSESGAGAGSGLASGSAKASCAGAQFGDSDAPGPSKRTRTSGNQLAAPSGGSLGPDACSERAAFSYKGICAHTCGVILRGA